MTFSLVMTVFETWELFPRALSCVLQQAVPDWELIVLVDGPSPQELPGPRAVVEQCRPHWKGPQRIEVVELPRAEGCWGNVARRTGLELSQGEYVCWLNHDNLITPQYLQAHRDNIQRTAQCVSVVDIDLWQRHIYRGRFPQSLRRSRVDLLCYAVPTEIARVVNAFGPAMERTYAADWEVFAACQSRLPVEWNHTVVGTHF